MKRLSILLTLALIGQSVLGSEAKNFGQWCDFGARFGTEILAAYETDQKSLEDFLPTIVEAEKAVALIPDTETYNLENAYNMLMPMLTGFKVEYKGLAPEAQIVAKQELQGKLAVLKAEVTRSINTFSRFGRMINAAIDAKNGVVNGATAVKNKALYGASVGIAFANDHRLATAGTVVATAAGIAAYKNQEALKTAGSRAVSYVKENAAKALSFTKENAPKALSYTKETGKNVGSAISDRFATGYNWACDTRLGMTARYTTAQAVDKLSEGYDWAYDAKPVIASRLAVYNGLDKAAELIAAHPTAVLRTEVAAGSAATVAGALKAVQMYKAYKTAKLAAEKTATRKALNLGDDVI